MRELPDTYRIIRKIGEGNGGEVFLAIHRNLNKQVVLKKIKNEVKDLSNNRAEVDVLKNLRHSHLPQVLDFLRIDGDVYTVMDYIPGRSFRDYLEAGEYFEEKHVLFWAKQICETIAYLHSQTPPIIHSDIKPGNIMLMPDGNICLIDFNISASLSGYGARVTGYTKGYAPPEQIEALHYNQKVHNSNMWMSIDERADIYSFGATLYHILTGQKPVMDRDGYVADIRYYREDMNDIFASIIMRCLEPDPDSRYPSASQVLQEMENIYTNDQRYRRMKKNQNILYALTGVGLVLSAGLMVAGFILRDSEKQDRYEDLVTKQQKSVSQWDYSSAEDYYDEAVALKPGKLDAYYEMALALKQQADSTGRPEGYEALAEYIDEQILGNRKISVPRSEMGDIYYLKGYACDKTVKRNTEAVSCYETAIDIDASRPDYYRDYAIALARLGKQQEAKDALRKASDNGLATAGLSFADGEIRMSEKDFDGAKGQFMQCISQCTENDEALKAQAYVQAAKCSAQADGSDQGLLSGIDLLEQGIAELGGSYRTSLLEQQISAYTKLASEHGESDAANTYNQKAAEKLEQIAGSRYATAQTFYNLACVYTDLKRFDSAAAALETMQQQYPEDYRTYAGLTYLEYRRNHGNPSSRFAEYYQMAKSRYDALTGAEDGLMIWLAERYEIGDY